MCVGKLKIILNVRKLSRQTKRAIIIVVLLFFLPFLSISYAFAKTSLLESSSVIGQKNTEESFGFNEGYHPIYRFINNHEYLIAPLSAMMAGEVGCGFWCAALGGLLGATDEVSIYFGYIDKHYLTSGFFGIATSRIIMPSPLSNVVGVVVGVLLPMGIFNEHNELVAPMVSVVAGSLTPGIGAMSGGIVGAMDELAIYNDITDKHYMTFSTVGMMATSLLGCFNPKVTNFLGVVLGFIAAEYEKEIFTGLTAPAKTTKNLYETYSKFISKDQLNAYIEKHVIALVGSQFVVQYLNLKSTEYRQNLNYNFERLDAPNGLILGRFQTELVNFAIFLFPYVVGQAVSGRIDNYFSKKIQFVLEDKISSELFSGETVLRLSDDNNTAILVDNLRTDLSIVVNSGSELITGAISTSIGGVYGIGIIIVSSPNLLIYYTVYNNARSFISDYLVAQQRFYGEKNIVLDSKIKNIMRDNIKNIRTITERDGVKFTGMRLKQLYELSREYEASKELWSSANNIWWSMSKMADYMFNYFLVANEITNGQIFFENRRKVQTASGQVSNLLSWPGRNAQLISSIDQSLDRIIVLRNKLHTSSKKIDQIIRTTQEGNQLVLQDLEVGINDEILVTVRDLALEMGNVYAITGESGCGKTSILSKIKWIEENGMFGKGHIYYPLVNGIEPKIVMVSQQDYFPTDASLQEVIAYPDTISENIVLKEEQREKIRLLLKEIGIDVFSANITNDDLDTKDNKEREENGNDGQLSLDSVKDWYAIFSGGEKKKILIVSAIIKNPDILILDEIFNGLDSKSIIIAQQMLRKYLPNSLILSVDHHAQDNNYDAFYNKELKFLDKSVILQEIITKNVMKSAGG